MAPAPAADLPTRTCVACRRTRPKRDLTRLVRTIAGEIVVDTTGKVNGRGAYLCQDDECWALAQRRRSLERVLKVSLTPEVWQNLLAARPASP